MNNTITSKVIGRLVQHNRFPDWWESNGVSVPFFDNATCPIIFSDFEPAEDRIFLEGADHALGNFLRLTQADREAISELAYENCMNFLADIGYDTWQEPLRQITDKHEIWSFIYPGAIYVTRRPYGDQDIYVQVTCECEWEEEHGLQLIFRQGKKLTRISEQDGHLTDADAYGIPDEEDKLLSEF